MSESGDEIFQKVKDRFLAACREVMLERLKTLRVRYTEVDPDILIELVILTGIGYLNRMARQEGPEHVSKFFDSLLQELTKVTCQLDDGLLEDIREAMRVKNAENKAESKEEITQVKVADPLPGFGLFGPWHLDGEN